MAGRRRIGRGEGGPNWIGTLLGMVVLVAAGFFVGVVAGVIWEEPELVARHLAGQDEELVWSPDAGAVFTEPRASAQARVDSSVQSETDAQPDSSAAPTWEEGTDSLPPVSSEGGRRPSAAEVGFAVQVGAFSEISAAENMARALGAKGYAVYVIPSTGSGGSRWRVRVGPVSSRSEAQELAGQLKRKQHLPTWVVSGGVD